MSMCSRPRKPHAEAEAERAGDFRLVVQRRVVEAQLAQRIAEVLVVVGDDREQPGEHARLDLLEAGQRLLAACWCSSVMVSPTGAPSISLMPAMTKPTSPVDRARVRPRDFGVKRPSLSTWCARPVDITRILSPTLERAVHDAHQRDDADVVVEPGVDDQRLQRRVRIALRRRDALDQLLRAAPRRPRRSWR